MNILLSGASGLVGTALEIYLTQQQHQVFRLNRGKKEGLFWWNPDEVEIHLPESHHIDAVICLNGVNIGDKRWSSARKKSIVDSRVNSTHLLSRTLAEREQKPSVFLAASAIGFYGDTGDTICDEDSIAGDNFLSDIVKAWEAAAEPAIQAGIRTVFMRSGVVLSPEGGALAKMLLPFKLGLGGRVGHGRQYMSWISLEDEVRAIEFLLNDESIWGAVNLTAPSPVTNQEFVTTLAQVLKRPAWFPMPEHVVKLLFGEMGQLLLLGSNRIQSRKLEAHGFTFKHASLKKALASML